MSEPTRAGAGAGAEPVATNRGPRVVVALDFADAAAALAFAERLAPGECRLKVGKELFTRGGPALVERLHGLGFDVFLDLKYHDIPNTVAGAVRAAADLGVWMVDVHAAGGPAMLSAAREALAGYARPPLLIAVTVLTSMDDAQLEAVALPPPASALAARYTALALEQGLDGVVCPALEVAQLRDGCPPGFVFVTPGIRPGGAGRDDQRRIATPGEAVRAGATYLVVGRPVTGAADPRQILLTMNSEFS